MNSRPKSNFKSRPPRTGARERALAEWRGVDLRPTEKALARTDRSVANLMPRVLTNLGLDRRRSEAEIARVWNHLIDPSLTAHARPTGLHKGTLFVTVDNSAWLGEIVRYRRKEILDRLQHSFGRDLITRISFRVG
jgi:predicted nucleic acid-binding Zn ribbon protein